MKAFETVSFHIVKPCNMKCKFCYATFNDMDIKKQLTLKEVETILIKLKNSGVKKVTFAGGEPMLYKQLDKAIIYAKSIGMTTSIITNGSLLTYEWLAKMKLYLDWIGLSIDSLNIKTNKDIGRHTNKQDELVLPGLLIPFINELKYKLKINTVVNIHNQDEILIDFISKSKTTRWKIFEALKVEGQNNKQYDEIKPTKFKEFIKNNQHPAMVVEDNRLMTGSYMLIDPQGRLFENSKGKHTYSDSLVSNTIEHCLNQIDLNNETFIERGGIYNW